MDEQKAPLQTPPGQKLQTPLQKPVTQNVNISEGGGGVSLKPDGNIQQEKPANKLEALGNIVLSKNPFELYKKQEETRKESGEEKADAPNNAPSRIQTLMRGKFSGSSLKPLRTYRGDVEEAVEKKKESVATIALAEKRRRQKRGEETRGLIKKETILQNGLIVFLIIALVVTGITSLFLFLYAKSEEQRAVSTFYKKTIIPADQEEKIIFSQGNMSALIREKINSLKEEGEGKIVSLYIYENEIETPATTLISELSPLAPAYLVRSFSGDYMLGALKKGAWDTFLILKTDSFEIGFSGMLEWEATLPDESALLFGFSPLSQPSAFEDRIIKNKDTRVLRNGSGDVVLIYGFLDRETILIAETPEVWGDILGRYFNSKLVQ